MHNDTVADLDVRGDYVGTDHFRRVGKAEADIGAVDVGGQIIICSSSHIFTVGKLSNGVNTQKDVDPQVIIVWELRDSQVVAGQVFVQGLHKDSSSSTHRSD